MTNCLRVIRNAWHFLLALDLVILAQCRGLTIALL
ncbi:DUF3265 domain-containing protein, partial [Vibrio parahaemolyticus]|nr:DUF3265 domain-containing protein [Vibrio parahaemolyticus]